MLNHTSQAQSSSLQHTTRWMVMMIICGVILAAVFILLWKYSGVGVSASEDFTIDESAHAKQTISEEAASSSSLKDDLITATAKKSAKKSTATTKSKPIKQVVISTKSEKIVLSASTKISNSQCLFSAPRIFPRTVIFNEVAWMGSLGDGSGLQDGAAEKEWLELKNISGDSIDLKDWQVINRDGSVHATLDHAVVKTGQLYVVERADAAADGKGYAGKLSDTGESLKLFDQRCHFIDELAAATGFPAGNLSTRQTLERDPDTFGWHTSLYAGGTKGKPNSLLLAALLASETNQPSSVVVVPPTPVDNPAAVVSTAPGEIKVLITKVQINGGTGKSDNDYVEILNAGPQAVDISGWKLQKRTQSGSQSSIKVFPDEPLLLPGESFFWANSSIAAAMGADVSSSQTLSTNNSVALLDASERVMDGLGWGDNLVGSFAEGTPYPVNPAAGQVLTRKTATDGVVDTDDNAANFELQ